MNSPIEDVKDILTGYDSSSSSPYDFGVSLFISHIPDSPDRCIALLDTGGFDPEVEIQYEKPTFQIHVRDRADKYTRCYTTVKNILEILHGNRFVVNSTIYVFWQQGDIFDLGRDKKNRIELTANVRIHRTPSS